MIKRSRIRRASVAALVGALGAGIPVAAHAAACNGATTACGGSTSVTYNGTAMTLYGAATNGTVRSEIWYMVAPPSGAHNVVVTAPNATVVTATSMSFTGVNQATPLGTIATAIGTSTAPTVSATAAQGEGIFDVMGAVGTTAPTVAGATQTLRQTNNTSTGADHVIIGSSTAYGTGSATTMKWTISSADWAHAAVPIKASTALTDVKVHDFTATWQSDRVLLTWRDGYEPESLGFYVYRGTTQADRVRMNAELIPGGAVVGSVSAFSWTDTTPAQDGSMSYWLEDVNVDGSSTWYGPAAAMTGIDPAGPDAAAPIGGGSPGGAPDAAAPSDAAPSGGCTVAVPARFGALQILLVLGLTVGIRRGRRRWVVVAIYLCAVAATTGVSQRRAQGAGGIAVDVSATGTGTSGLTFSHTMGAGSNGLLLVGVVVPIVCDTLMNDNGNCGACGTTCSLNPAASLSTGLLGLWHFDEGSGSSSADSSGNANTATLVSSPAWVTGYENKGIETDGTASYVEAPIGTWFGGNNNLTAAVWVYVTANTNGPVFGVTDQNPPGNWNMPFLSVQGANVYGWMWGMSTLTTTVSLNAWHLLAITYSPSGGAPGIERFYVDGSQVSSATGTYSPSGDTDYFSTYISGAKPGTVQSYLVGKIDEVRAYNRVLSAAEITSLFGARLSCSGSACAACPGGTTSCSGSCVTLSSDSNNCGSCGHVCNTAGGESCVSGSCACASGTDCSTVCVDTTTNSNNCGGCGIVCSIATSAGMDSSLVGRWHLDEGSGSTSADSSGNGRTATLTGSPTWTAGYSSYGLTFNGSSNYINASLGTSFGSNTTLSATAWVYATATTNGPIFGVTDTPPGGGWNMPFLSIAGSTVYGHLWMVNSNTPLSATVSLNAWHFLAITYNPSTSPSEYFYVDGALSSSASGTYSPSGVSDTWTTYIPGAKPTGVNTYLTGEIDEVRAYNRTLSAADVSILYNARQTCSASACGGCGGGETICSGACTNKTIDNYNCGSCGTTCNVAGGESCISSACGCVSGTDCSGTCTSTVTDQNNCGMCGHACNTVTCGSCSQTMAGLWHMDEGSGSTSADSSGSGHTLTLVNNPTWTTGQTGNALSFDGATNYATATLGATFGGNNAISANAWVYATSTTNGPIFGVTSTLPGTGWDMPFLSINGSTVYGWLWQVNGNTPLSATVSLNAWHMLTITYDPSGSGTERFYVDGALSSSGTGTYSPSGTTDFLTTYISGAKPSGVNSYLSGKIDELRGYNRLLSAGEVALLYNAKQVCSGSACGGCPSGTTSCSGACTNTLYDKNNCNGCGTVCPGAQTCVAGACM